MVCYQRGLPRLALHQTIWKLCIHTKYRLIYYTKKANKSKLKISFICDFFSSIFNCFSRHDLSPPQILLTHLSLKFCDPAVINRPGVAGAVL